MLQHLVKYRNHYLLAVLVVALVITGMRHAHSDSNIQTVSLPVTYAASSDSLSAMERYRQERNDTQLQDLAALQYLIDNSSLDAQTRSDAAARAQKLIEQREKQTALEGCLLETSLWPCVAVLSSGSVTVITEKASVTDRENTLLTELAYIHTGVEKSGISVICSEKK